MRIDSHQHFWRYSPETHAWIDDNMKVIRKDFMPANLHPYLRAHQIDGCIAVQADQTEEETGFLLSLAMENDFIKGVVGWVDLRASTIEERLGAYFGEPKLCGFRHIVQAEPDDNFMLKDDFQRGIGLLKQFGFTYDILVYPQQLPAAIKLVERFPSQPFVLDHMAKPLIKTGKVEPWASLMKELAQAQNVYCKLSGIITEADYCRWTAEQVRPYLDIVFEAFGIKKLMFGSDWPVCLVAGSYGDVVNLVEEYSAFNATVGELIFGQNAASFYKIKL